MKASTILVFLGTALTLVAWAPEPYQVNISQWQSEKNITKGGYEFKITFGHRKVAKNNADLYWGQATDESDPPSMYVHVISHIDISYKGKHLTQALWAPSFRGISEVNYVVANRVKNDVALVIEGSDAAGGYHAALDLRDGQAQWFKVYHLELPESNSYTYFHLGAGK